MCTLFDALCPGCAQKSRLVESCPHFLRLAAVRDCPQYGGYLGVRCVELCRACVEEDGRRREEEALEELAASMRRF